jgi:hypothetical protein
MPIGNWSISSPQAFKLAAEKLCLDDAAQGRASQRMRRLENTIEARLRGLEERSRKHGWSFIKDFLKENFSRSRKPGKWDDVR